MADLPSSNILCRYFLENTCRAGDKCKFVHDISLGQLDEECRFYRRNGECRYGRQCYYDHIRHAKYGSIELVSKGKKSLERQIPLINDPDIESDPLEPGATAHALLPLCKEYRAAGTCRSTDCSAVHGGLCKRCEEYVVHPYNRYFNLVHESQCKSREATVPTLRMELLSQSTGLMCGVCLEVVYDKPGKGSKRFGLLSDCPHVFCWECAREWRQEGKLGGRKTCPECRIPSETMTPSVFHVREGEVKEALLKEHQERSRMTPGVKGTKTPKAMNL